ncbi:MAG TPA: hypothetical protein VGN57_14235 [Pirellulaceae bacterium]|nr:hypothetical protein [Pirellulaceae bacterium]
MAIDAAAPLLAAAATAALAICAHDWAVGRIADEANLAPVHVAAVAGLSAVLGGTRLPLLVRVALHLGSLWILQRYVGAGGDGAPPAGLFFVSMAAFFGGAAAAILSNRWLRRAGDDRRPLATGDLIAALFAFSAYVAVGQHVIQFTTPWSSYAAELAVLNALLPYAILILLETLLGRAFASVSLCLAALAVAIVLPELSFPFDPFATVLIVALRIVGRPLQAPASDLGESVAERSRTPVPPAA